MIPVLGEIADSAKILKAADKAVDAAKVANKASDAVKSAKQALETETGKSVVTSKNATELNHIVINLIDNDNEEKK